MSSNLPNCVPVELERPQVEMKINLHLKDSGDFSFLAMVLRLGDYS